MRLLRCLVTVWLLTGLLAAQPAAAQTDPVARTTVTFVLVSDIYLLAAQTGQDGRMRGGFARLAAVVKAERAKGGHVIVAHGGDTLSPSLMSGLDHGASIMRLTNMVSPDIFVPGNHEFDFGPDVFHKRMAEATFPLYAANLREADGSTVPGFRDHTILTFDGVRIGLTGATDDATPRTSTPGKLRFAPTIATVKEQARALRREGADMVVAVVHADRAQDMQLYQGRDVDLTLSGHDHDLFIAYDERAAVVESSYDAHYVTAVDVTITVTTRDGHRRTTWWPRFRIIDTATVTPDPEVAAVVAGYEKQLAEQMDRPIGTTAVTLDSRSSTVRTGEATIGNVIADAMRAETQSDVAVLNGGGIRAGRIYEPGTTLTRRDVLAELPFGNKVVKLELTGKALRAAIENGLGGPSIGGGKFPQVSGLTVTAERSRPSGDRITAMSVNGAPLQDDRLYTVATVDFLGRGGDAYVTFRDAKHLTSDADSPPLAQTVMAYVAKQGTIRTAVEGRITLK